MTNMQRLVLVLAFIFAVLLGILLATTLFGGKGGSASPTARPSGSAAASMAPSVAPSGAQTSPSAAPSEAASPSVVPSATPKPATAATITFSQLTLDATTDAAGANRSIAFAGQAGTVTVKLATESGGNTVACLLGNGKQLVCKTATSGTLTGKSTRASTNYTLTLRGAANARPTVSVTIAFPAARPKVTIKNARFDGTDAPALNGLQVVAVPRAKGYYHVTASWGGHPFLYEVDLIEQAGPGLKQVVATTAATGVSQGFAVTKPNGWMIVLKNTEAGFGTTPLTATFTWP